MPAKTPVLLSDLRAAPTTATWIHPTSGDLHTAGTLTRGDFPALRHTMWYFANIDNTDTWTSGIDGIKHVALKVTSAGTADVALTTIATGLLTFNTSAVDQTIILHVWSAG